MTHLQVEEQELLELYLLERLPAEAEAELEEHLLQCPQCLDAFERERQCIKVIRGACVADPFEARERQGTPPSRRGLKPLWAWGAALALGVAALGVVVAVRPGPAGFPAGRTSALRRAAPAAALPVVALESFRGGSAAGATIAAPAAAKPFLLRLDGRGLAAYEQYFVEVAADSGEAVWRSGGVTRAGDSLEIRVENAALGAGAYWVRLYGSEAGGKPELLREYSLVVGG